MAVRQAPDDIRETVEKAPESPEGGRSLYLIEKIKTVGENISSIGTRATEKVFAKGIGNYVQGSPTGTRASSCTSSTPPPRP
ncbi:hypothetical protein WBG99_08740 [Streptomyces sp. TG1A-60]|uniref:hypothetical protein n=1 Tax=Streptomyces sp. TG1A-60 TaxID=3129111 RepID=UPI0030CC3C79